MLKSDLGKAESAEILIRRAQSWRLRRISNTSRLQIRFRFMGMHTVVSILGCFGPACMSWVAESRLRTPRRQWHHVRSHNRRRCPAFSLMPNIILLLESIFLLMCKSLLTSRSLHLYHKFPHQSKQWRTTDTHNVSRGGRGTHTGTISCACTSRKTGHWTQ